MQVVQAGIPRPPLVCGAAPPHISGGRMNGVSEMSYLRHLFPRRLSRREAELGYLNAAVSRNDLERREREIDQGKFASR